MPESDEPAFDRFLVTGGAGFIGSHIVNRLLDLGKRVYVLDDFSTGKRRNLRRDAVDERLRVVKGSVTNPTLVRDLIRKVDCVFHEAAQVSVTKSMKDPDLTNRINVKGTLLLLRACLRKKGMRFVYASSSSVYGDIGNAAADEEMAPKPGSPYASSKLSAESYVTGFARSYGLRTASLRYFNVFGARQNSSMYGGVVSIFVRRIQAGAPLVIYGDGRQTRDFIHVSDVVEANMRAANLEPAGEAINVGTGKAVSILELSNLISGELGRSDLAPVFASPRPGDILHSRADVTKQKAVLGFEPKTTLQEGIRSMLW